MNQTETQLMHGIPAKSAVGAPLENRGIDGLQQLVTQ
jgi:hypothetical protein